MSKVIIIKSLLRVQLAASDVIFHLGYTHTRNCLVTYFHTKRIKRKPRHLTDVLQFLKWCIMMLLCTLEMLTACFAGSGHSIYKGIPAGILLNPKYLLQCFGSI